MSGPSDITLTGADGTPVRVFRRSKGGSTKKRTARPRRPVKRVVIQDRHSQLAGRDRQPDAQDRFLAPQADIAACERLAADRGYTIVDRVSFWNYTGTELDRLEPYIEEMEANPPTVDAIVFLSWDRYSRSLEEGPTIVERVRQAGGDLIFVDNPTLDIYDEASQPYIAMLNAIAAVPSLKAKKAAQANLKLRAEQGRAAAAIWCYRKRDHAEEVVLANGEVERSPQGTLVPVPEEFAFGTEVYNKLYARVPPKDVVYWLNTNGQRPRGVRVRNDDGTVTERAKEQWDTDQLRVWVRNPINKGYVQLGDHVSGKVHEAVTTEEIWNDVNLNVYGTRTGGGSNPGLLSGVLRCQFCRGTLSLNRDDGAPKRYACTRKYCGAHASVEARLIEPLVESKLYTALHAQRERLELQSAAADDEHLARLRRAAQEAVVQMGRVQADLRQRIEHPDRYDALCRAAEESARAAGAELDVAQRVTRVEAVRRNALDDWASLTTSEKRTLVACTWPVVWVRSGEFIDDSGCLRRNVELEDRLWFIADGDEQQFVLPRKGHGWEPAAHEPVAWPDGSWTPTAEERRQLRDTEIEAGPGVVVTARTPAEDAERWEAARRHFLRNGRTSEEVLAAWRQFGSTRGTRELGMSLTNMQQRVRQARIAAGEIEGATVVERVRRKNYTSRLVSDEEVLAAVDLCDGKTTLAARELGMPVNTLRYRLLRARAAENEEVRAELARQREIRRENSRKRRGERGLRRAGRQR